MIAQFGKFAGSGLMGTLCHYAVLFGLVNHHIPPLAASSFGMAAGAVIVYLANYYMTFSSYRRHIDVIKRFLPMLGVGFCLNGLILFGVMEYLEFSLAVSQVIATSGQFLFGFIISRQWVF